MIETERSAQPALVLRPDELPTKNRGGGARTVPLVTYGRGATTYLNGMTVFDPGAQIGHHVHNVAESVMVIDGEAIVDIDGHRIRLNTYDTTFVPANVPHHFENASTRNPMRIFWTYGSIDSTRTLLASGEHGRIDDEAADSAGPSAAESVTELALLRITPGREREFEAAVADAASLFQTAHGARTFTVERSVELPSVYRLLVRWETIEDHLVGFRDSPAFRQWRDLVGDFLEAPPEVEHLRNVLTAF
ncbi:quercetin dioxygenase-like cupin family protein/quinol monooxygenase YgiN [Microbacterium resistens]|uniref:Quercetin dioxygenase-like cupin family protein/quinol monooxygenase YgiN n=1 Tax=Microbacterium resistens TaxID=156977 RepID=A0ABU1SGS4_9MICO|nr:cupin domain-containing protein [Microbacterium resistens]MDR6868791.1 quercetin dioxygenase-like cupin family protein/quinol monooxygenase YgiN [Microbacterium resistens]